MRSSSTKAQQDNNLIAIANFGLGNVKAIETAYKRLNITVKIANTTDDLKEGSKIILPGVGSFDWAMQKLEKSGLKSCLDELVLDKKVPVLGVCVGMHLMAKSSDEGQCAGLGWIDADVKKLATKQNAHEFGLPHMGWNNAAPAIPNELFSNIDNQRFYFLHSYYFNPSNNKNVLSYTDYSQKFASAIKRDNIYGVQFHPEKSHNWGLALLKNFAML